MVYLTMLSGAQNLQRRAIGFLINNELKIICKKQSWAYLSYYQEFAWRDCGRPRNPVRIDRFWADILAQHLQKFSS
jgi:hypothetical protein